MSDLTIGAHLSCAKGYENMAREAASIGANTFQFFTRNPRGGKAKLIDPDDIAAFEKAAEENGIKVILAHAPYTLNPASSKPDTRRFAIDTLADDLDRMENTPGQLYNMHPGAHVGQGPDVAVGLVADAINEALRPDHSTTLLLETMAGKGSEMGRSFDELAQIIDRIELSDKVGVCLDTCHIWDGGYDVADSLDEVLEDFDKRIGLSKLRAVHINDSKNVLGAAKDRHEVIGGGEIGLEALAKVTAHPALRSLPFYLETPHDKVSDYADEIEMIKKARKKYYELT